MSHPTPKQTALMLACLGVVYGDIGTSPLYALRETFRAVPLTSENVLGALSLIFWSLILLISVFYLLVLTRADNEGEGGILALVGLVCRGEDAKRVSTLWLLPLGLFGAALLFGDGIITPAISVLSAMEGLSVAAPALQSWVVPCTVAVLVVLFLFQYRGTAAIGAVFGPVTLCWFVMLGVFGLGQIVRNPGVLVALNPWYGAQFLMDGGWRAVMALGAIFLVVTGAEVLYADMGHFGPTPIRKAWFQVVLPCLVLNYFGQGALILREPATAANPFYLMLPGWAVWPMVGLATAATVIASQSGISGVFSLTRQAMQLGYAPRMEVRHTSESEIGQVYVPAMNRIMLVATVLIVLAFRNSSGLAAAYGLGVATTMVISMVMLHAVLRRKWGWTFLGAGLFTGFFLSIGSVFFAANALKLADGGWIPILLGLAVFTLMATWSQGRAELARQLAERTPGLDDLSAALGDVPAVRVDGTAIYLTASPTRLPVALVHNVLSNKVLHERVVLLTLVGEAVPEVALEASVSVLDLGDGFTRVTARYGFMQKPDAMRVLAQAVAQGLAVNLEEVTFFVGRESLVGSAKPVLGRWRRELFALLSRNATPASDFFGLPPGRVVEIGVQLPI